MIHAVRGLVRALASGVGPPPRRLRPATVALGMIGAAVGLAVVSSPAGATPGCNITASPSTFSSAVSSAAPGQTLCLTSGSYGTWSGTSKPITVTAAAGASPEMTIDFGSGASGFTLEHMTGMGGCISSGASNITIRYNVFANGTSSCGGGNLTVQGAVTHIVISANDLTYPVQSGSTGSNSKIFLDTSGSGPGAAATVENNVIANGDLDGVHIGGGSGDLIAGNTIKNLCDRGVNHTDNIQFEGGSQITVARNYVYEDQSCPTQGITAYDGHIRGLLIEDNVVDIPRDWGIELYSDQSSTVVHNTVVWHPTAYSEFHSGTGQIDVDRKSQDPAGTGTHVYNNIGTVGFTNGSTGAADHNVSGQNALYVGPLTTWAGYRLSPRSPVGVKAASDGLNDGARISAPSSPPPPPPPRRNPTPPRAARPHGLVLSLGFGERSGAAVIDSSGQGNNGRLHGARRTRAGRHGRGLLLSGRHGFVSVPNSRTLRLTRSVTLMAWVRPGAGGHRWRSVIVKRGSRNRAAYGLFADDRHGQVSAALVTRARHAPHTRVHLRLHRWSALAVTYNGRVARIYVNGRLRRSQRIRGALRPGRGPLTIGGSRALGGWFKGVIDDVRVWDVALSAKRIRRQMRVSASA